MQTLQDLYDFYIKTMPSRGKVKSATTLMIRVTKAMEVSSAEDITDNDIAVIPEAIDRFYKSSPDKATQDKSMLAEMIGRYGPKDGWEKAFDILLNDKDENLRQFSLSTLEYIADSDPDLVITYIRRYMDSADELMRDIAANLASRLLCGEHREQMKKMSEVWRQDGHQRFLEEIRDTLEVWIRRREKLDQNMVCKEAFDWLNAKLSQLTND